MGRSVGCGQPIGTVDRQMFDPTCAGIAAKELINPIHQTISKQGLVVIHLERDRGLYNLQVAHRVPGSAGKLDGSLSISDPDIVEVGRISAGRGIELDRRGATKVGAWIACTPRKLLAKAVVVLRSEYRLCVGSAEAIQSSAGTGDHDARRIGGNPRVGTLDGRAMAWAIWPVL